MQRIIVTAIIALAGLALAHAGGSQFPAQRFAKVTADSLALTSGTQVMVVAAPDVARWNSLSGGIATEKDPVFSASPAGAITGADVAAWNSFVVNNAWLTNVLYPAEALTLRSLNLSRLFGTPHRLLVQGYKDAAWSGNLTLNLGSGSSAEIRAAHLFSNLPIYQTAHYQMLDHDTGNVWWVYTEPAGLYWLAYKFDVPTQVNRVRHYKFGGWGNPWPSFTVWGSDDSTNGSDGHWTQISSAFTLSSNMSAVNTCDFAQNTRSFLWVKLVGAPKTVVENAGVSEIEFESYQPAPDKRFWVDTRGNPATDGVLTAGALTLTSGTLAAKVDANDVARWNGLLSGMNDEHDPVFLASAARQLTSQQIANWDALYHNTPWIALDATRATSDYRKVIIGGRVLDSTHQLLVQGFDGTAYSADLSKTTSPYSWAPSDGVFTSSGYGNRIFDDNTNFVHDFGSEDPRWVAARFVDGNAKKVNRIAMFRGSSQTGLPWTSFSVLGSLNSTNGADGDWTPITSFTVSTTLTGWNYFDFTDNRQYYNWIKVSGPRNSSINSLIEMSLHSFDPIGAKNFWVDARGNPGTDGVLTAATLALTTNSLTQSITQQDVRNWNTNLAVWSPLSDGAAITSRQAQVAIGATAINTERLLVQGYLPTSTYNPFSERALTSFDNKVYVFTSSNWNNTPPYPVFDGLTTGEWWRPSTGAQWIATKNPSGLARVVNRVSFYQGGYWVPFDTFQVLGSNDSTTGADGTWTLLGGPFLARNGAGWENYDLPTNAAAFKWHKIAGSVADLSSRLTYEIRFSTYSPTPDKKFTVDAHGNPGTDGTMTAGSYCYTPLTAAPDSPTTGTAYFDNASRKLRVWDGAAWQDAW